MGQKKQPAVKSEWRYEIPGAGAVVLRSERELRYLTGRLMVQLVPLVDGTRTVQEISNALRSEFSEEQIAEALCQLQQEGYLREGVPAARADEAFWTLLDADPENVTERRSAVTVELLTSEPATAVILRDALNAVGISVMGGGSFIIAVVQDYLDEQLRQLNVEALASGRPWMLVRPFGRKQWVGPVFVPGRTACWSCMSQILELNGWAADACVAALPVSASITQTIAAAEAAKWLLTESNDTIEGSICEIDTGLLGITSHTVRAQPGCPDCNGKAANGHDLDKLISPLTGIVSRLRMVHNEASFAVYAAEMAQYLRPDGSGDLLYTRPGVTAGKGRHPEEARLRCLYEAIERYSTQLHGDEQRITSSLHELGERAIDPRALMLFSDEQYAKGQRVPPRFDPAAQIEWTAVHSLVTGSERFVPTAYAFYGYGHPACGADSNGCAAGKTLADAIVRGFLELVERDAVSIWWYNRVPRPALPLEDASERILELHTMLRRRLALLHVLDITTDLGIPAAVAIGVAAVSRQVLLGAGSGPDRNTSARRALEELAAHAVEPDPVSIGEIAPWMLPSGTSAPEELRCSDTLEACVQRASELSLDVFTLDLTRPETGVPVARVIVPGLRPWRPRFAPGRLFDVPVALGWRTTPLTESELNPVAFPL